MTIADGDAEACVLCGLPLAGAEISNDAGNRFCCTGCREIHDALDDLSGVEGADLQERRPADVDPGPPDTAPPADGERAFLRLDGMHCTTCEAFIETVAVGTDGVDDAVASYVTEVVRVDYDPGQVTEDDLVDRLSVAGYTASRTVAGATASPADDSRFWRLAIGAMLGMWVMLPYLVLVYPVHFGFIYPSWMVESLRGMLTSQTAQYFFGVMAFISGLVLWITGAPLLRGAYVSLRTRSPNMDLLVTLAVVGAYLFSTVSFLLGRLDVYYDVTVAIVLVVSAGSYYESTIKHRATETLSALTTAQVDEARRYDDGTTRPVQVGDLEAGAQVLVRAGERIPLDGIVVEGDGTVDESIVTGESLPTGKGVEDTVVGGSIVTDGALVVEVGDAATSSLERITNLVWNLKSTDHGVQRLADRLAVIFVPAVVTLSALAGGAYLALGASVPAAVLVSLTVLLVSCPCALGLATPLAVAAGIREALDRGIVIFDTTVFDRLRSVDVLVFDKTGTLTTGELRLLESDLPADLAPAVAALERRASHPVADAIVRALEQAAEPGRARADGGLQEHGPEPAPAGSPAVEDFRTLETGVAGVVDGLEVLVGHPDLFRERGWTLPPAVTRRVDDAREHGRLAVVAGRDGRAEAVLVAGDEPREGWDDVVAGLDARGIDVVVLTGDEASATTAFRRHPGIDRVFASVPPEAKVETIRRLGTGRRVAMVGDGTNDAPALAAADLGIALGGGTAMAVDAADVAIVDDDLASIEAVFDLAAAARTRVRQNIGWAFGYNVIAIPLAVFGLLNPLFATVAMATSSILVVTNSSRALLGGDSE